MDYERPPNLPSNAIIVLGVVGEHDDAAVTDILDHLTAWMMAYRGMPLIPKQIKDDCLVAPKERGGVHVEVRWIVV